MNKVLRFSKFDTRKRLIQYSLTILILLLLSFYIFNKANAIIRERRVERIQKYTAELSTLKEDKEENLRQIEREYDEKIQKLQIKIDTLREKVDMN
ncbi:hypothetical protein PM10SUCC1_13760 [Propionigenium maris DSM 9537]|uniref:Uncharacterized protein n=1 Tax=Propionigenium maris DSM 9537 TaxID=1123000 RepID=A0A9W6LMQ0_9FUSO|nr:hypothetical protein [Propionigenium maris]GLI55862.1 hypothetical protein PM10SUCC1_13760 [Propionigenium maris DSM 9537]